MLVGYETFAGRTCELANGQVVTPGSLLPWLSEAYVERVVFGPASRVIDVGRTRRLFTGAARRAAKLNNDTCYHRTCDEPAGHCQTDHIAEWRKGGTTSPDNGRPACSFHNRLRNRQPDGDDEADDPP